MTTEKVLRSDARRNLELILQAAGEAFAEGGLEVGVADIARRAGVGTATIFRRFPTKEDLVAAVFESRLEEVESIARACADMDSGIESVRAFLERAIDFQLRDRGFLESVGKRRFASDPRFAACHDAITDALERITARAQAAGEMRDDVTAADLMVLLHALCSGAAFVERDGMHFSERYLDLMIDGLRPTGATPLRRAAPTFAELAAAKERL